MEQSDDEKSFQTGGDSQTEGGRQPGEQSRQPADEQSKKSTGERQHSASSSDAAASSSRSSSSSATKTQVSSPRARSKGAEPSTEPIPEPAPIASLNAYGSIAVLGHGGQNGFDKGGWLLGGGVGIGVGLVDTEDSTFAMKTVFGAGLLGGNWSSGAVNLNLGILPIEGGIRIRFENPVGFTLGAYYAPGVIFGDVDTSFAGRGYRVVTGVVWRRLRFQFGWRGMSWNGSHGLHALGVSVGYGR